MTLSADPALRLQAQLSWVGCHPDWRVAHLWPRSALPSALQRWLQTMPPVQAPPRGRPLDDVPDCTRRRAVFLARDRRRHTRLHAGPAWRAERHGAAPARQHRVTGSRPGVS